MLLKERCESDELKIMRSLNTRMELAQKDKYHYLNLEKGYEGEIKFDRLLVDLLEERYVINDLLLKVNNSYFQIDTLIISQVALYLIDVKNFEDDCYIDGEKLRSAKTDREYQNPLVQLERCSSLFRQLLQNLKFNYLVESSAVFINPEFTLYQAPMKQPFILPTQLNRFLRDLNNAPSKLNEGHNKLAQTLISLHQTKNPFTYVPEYSYEKVHKGICCAKCNSFTVTVENKFLICKKCGAHEKIESAILRNVEEVKLLFPNLQITTNLMIEWCKSDICKKTFTRTLMKHYIPCGKNRGTYYK